MPAVTEDLALSRPAARRALHLSGLCARCGEARRERRDHEVVGEETLAFPPGKGYRIDTSREIATDIHLLNTTGLEPRVEVVYDFFTMPEGEIVDEMAPFALSVNDFVIPPHTTGDVGATCVTGDGATAGSGWAGGIRYAVSPMRAFC